MPKPSRDPWIAVDATIRKNAKMVALPSDSARWGWIAVLGEAKLQRPQGRFASRTHVQEVAGRFAKFVLGYFGVGLLEDAAHACDRCRRQWRLLPAGSVVVHDWHLHQRDPDAAERAAGWRDTQPDDRSITVQSPFDDSSMGVLSPFNLPRAQAATATETKTETENGSTTPVRAVAPTPIAATRKKTPKGWTHVGSVDWGMTLDQRQLRAWESFGHEWDAFKDAWLGRGLRYPPKGSPDDDPDAGNPSQRALLWSILNARPNDLVEWVSDSPKGSVTEVIAHVLRQWHGIRELVGRETA